MARAVWNGAITFGLVNIPIKVYGASEERDLRFTTLHAVCKSPLKRPYTCPVCNTPVESKDMVKGYEYGKGNFILLTEEEMDAVAVETSKAVQVIGFVDANEISPLFFDRSYFLGPDEASVKPYELLRQALARADKVAIARATLWKKEHLVGLRAIGGALVLSLLFYKDEVKESPEVPMTRPLAISDQEMDLAFELIQKLTMEFEPGKYSDRYREALLAMIEAKVEGKEIAVPPPSSAQPTQDLMAALRASLDAVKKA